MADELEERLRTGLAPHYELVRPIGRGSHALVYLARQPALKRFVAIKALRPELNRDKVLRRRFEREAVSAAKLDHPNVTRVHDVGQLDDELPYIIMKYVDGRTLEDAIAANGAFPVEEAKTLLAGLASALAAAHAAGIVHRDVRPGNVFIEKSSGRAILADFGIAGLLESGGEAITRLTESGIRLGETGYMSPEQIQGASATEQSDVYSFGVLAYEVLTGSGPYEASNPQQQIVAHLQQKPKRLETLVPSLDRPLADMIERCLDKEPNRRPLAADIAARLSGQYAADDAGPAPSGAVRFIDELKRRKVVRVTIAYMVSAAATIVGSNELPDALGYDWPGLPRIVAVIAAAGIPVVIVLSWIYDITESGISRTAGGPTGDTRRVALTLLGIAIVLSGLLAWFLPRLF